MSGLEASLIIEGANLALDGLNLFVKKRQEKIDQSKCCLISRKGYAKGGS